MSQIFITGDTHFDHDIAKLMRFEHRSGEELTKDDYMIVCGDFGLLWNYKETGRIVPSNSVDNHWAQDEYELYEWYNDLPWTTLWVSGNHENYDRLETYPISEWHGGRVQKISDSIIHLMRGEVYEIDGETFFTFGGAQSTDRGAIKGEQAAKEAIGKYWWPQEIPTTEELNHAMTNLAKYDDKIDYVITHDCPQHIKNFIYSGAFDFYNNTKANVVSKMLEMIYNVIEYRHWFCGHLHIDRTIDNVTVTYNKIYPIDFNFDIESKYRSFGWEE